MEWVNVKDRLQDKNGEYLVACKCFQFRHLRVLKFALNLHDVDDYDFPNENRPGWYELGDEMGYFERTSVTHWAELPELPED